MKKPVILALSLLCAAASALAWTVPDETLRYSVRYKWGLIDANAGVATIQTVNDPAEGTFSATLTGRSVDLLGHYYAAADTITGTIMADDFRPVYSERLYGESGEFAIETITYDHSGASSEGSVVKRFPDGKVLRSRVSHYGGGLTLDLLAVFYYVRQIPYESMRPGETVTVDIFAGKIPETLAVTYGGRDSGAFSVSLEFSGGASGGGAVDRMEMLVSDDDRRVPLRVDGSLKIGRIECRLLDADTPGI